MLSKEKQEMLKYYNMGLVAYKQRKWDEAIKAFEMAVEVMPDDGPSTEYLRRSRQYRDNPPPEDWDGVFVMTTK